MKNFFSYFLYHTGTVQPFKYCNEYFYGSRNNSIPAICPAAGLIAIGLLVRLPDQYHLRY